ncbi:MAG: L-seryl-tRNA(Sec) selenium transferase, partial [Deltaproteobacteria bacterium]|nr:L-seryl-tRNA(Sec) selenium transferase [Deltaproteobacteria bacterium]
REIAAGRTPDLAPATLAAAAAARLREALSPSLVPVINATGVIIHTNLGRAPLGAGPLAALAAVAAWYSNLEYDLAAGTRGSRFAHLAGAFARVAGAEAALVVNNNAAAVLLALTALARGREVVISRGELIEIGGSFRIPDVMAAGGARLREVGTTNRTHLRDYEAALGPETALLMIAHRSNFTVEGFTAGVERAALVALGRPRGVPVYEDLGSGCLVDLAPLGIRGVDTVSAALAAGVDLVSFSGDKLLGGPQAGILLGRPELIARLRRHPLARALRPDRLTLAGLEAVLRDYLSGDPWSRVPVLRMLSEPLAAVRARAERLALELAAQDLPVEVVETTARVGGGAAPDASLPSAGVRVQNAAAALEAGLRAGRPPVLGRLEDAALILDLRTVGEDQVGALRDAVRRAARAIAP